MQNLRTNRFTYIIYPKWHLKASPHQILVWYRMVTLQKPGLFYFIPITIQAMLFFSSHLLLQEKLWLGLDHSNNFSETYLPLFYLHHILTETSRTILISAITTFFTSSCLPSCLQKCLYPIIFIVWLVLHKSPITPSLNRLRISVNAVSLCICSFDWFCNNIGFNGSGLSTIHWCCVKDLFPK